MYVCTYIRMYTCLCAHTAAKYPKCDEEKVIDCNGLIDLTFHLSSFLRLFLVLESL